MAAPVRRWGGRLDMLPTIAGSMITVAGVVFSITIVSPSLASSRGEPADEPQGAAAATPQQVLGAIPGRRSS